MLLRLLFVLLIALNIAVAAWLLLGDTGTHAVDPTDAGVPKLRLLAEVPNQGAPAAATTAATPGSGGSRLVGELLPPAAAATTPTPPQKSGSGPARELSPKAPGPGTTAMTPPTPAPSGTAPGGSRLVGELSPMAPEHTTAIATPKLPAPAPAPAPSRRSFRCLAVGPFATQPDLRAARTALAPHTVRSRQRQEQTSESHGWRVFLPTQPTRELALAQARRLEAKGIKDYFVVTAQGELQNSVALGLFHDPANARKRRDEVAAAGFPARMAERTETTPVWWLDVVVPEEGNSDIRRSLHNPAISARPTGCF